MQTKNFPIDTDLYPEDLIEQGIHDFKGFPISYGAWVLSISADTEAQIMEIFNEFMNHSLVIFSEAI